MPKKNKEERSCRMCGCTDNDCSQCVQKTGYACWWIAEDLCSACEQKDAIQKALKPLNALKVFNKSVKKNFQLSDYGV